MKVGDYVYYLKSNKLATVISIFGTNSDKFLLIEDLDSGDEILCDFSDIKFASSEITELLYASNKVPKN